MAAYTGQLARELERAMAALRTLQHLCHATQPAADPDGLRHVIAQETATALAALGHANTQCQVRRPLCCWDRIRPPTDPEKVYTRHCNDEAQTAYDNYDDDYEDPPPWSELPATEQEVWREKTTDALVRFERRQQELAERDAAAAREWTARGYDTLTAAAHSAPQ
jgi:hypothetical protein